MDVHVHIGAKRYMEVHRDAWRCMEVQVQVHRGAWSCMEMHGSAWRCMERCVEVDGVAY